MENKTENTKSLPEIMSDISMTVLLEKASNISQFYNALSSSMGAETKTMLILFEFYPDIAKQNGK